MNYSDELYDDDGEPCFKDEQQPLLSPEELQRQSQAILGPLMSAISGSSLPENMRYAARTLQHASTCEVSELRFDETRRDVQGALDEMWKFIDDRNQEKK